MITPSHMVYAWALSRSSVTGSVQSTQKTVAFVLGALTPDVPVYIFFLVEGLLLGTPHEVMWDHMYFESWWSVLFTLSHSMILWPLLIGAAYLLRAELVKWFALSALIHVCTDFLVHTQDSYKHFWPLTDWRFISPISYWDRASFGDIVGVFDAAVILGLLLWLYRGSISKSVRIFIVVLGLAYLSIFMMQLGQVMGRL